MDAADRDRWFRLGLGLHAEKRWAAAAACFARCMGSGDPAFEGQVLANWGWNLHLVGRNFEALGSLLGARSMLPGEGGVGALLAQVMVEMGSPREAMRSAAKAVAVAPDLPLAHMSLAFAAAAAGEWETCWREYEWRFRFRADLYGSRTVPLWRGEPVSRLWLECEMGLGDTIFGMRWVEEALGRVEGMVLHVQPELLGWVRGLFADRDDDRVEILPTPRAPPEDVEAWCPLLSLPVALGMEAAVVAAGYCRENAIRRVGICWAGNPAHEQAHHRDCPLPYWIRLAENSNIELHSLQVGGTQALAQMGLLELVRDRGPEITNFADTAAILAELDLVITVDTAVAHLAAMEGVPTWVLINQRGQDFRWGQVGEKTEWYLAMRLFRRPLQEDWAAVLERVDAELRR